MTHRKRDDDIRAGREQQMYDDRLHRRSAFMSIPPFQQRRKYHGTKMSHETYK